MSGKASLPDLELLSMLDVDRACRALDAWQAAEARHYKNLPKPSTKATRVARRR